MLMGALKCWCENARKPAATMGCQQPPANGAGGLLFGRVTNQPLGRGSVLLVPTT